MLSEEEEALCDQLIARLAHTVKVKQMLIRPTMDDYHKNVNSPILIDQVTKAQFRNGLSLLGLQHPHRRQLVREERPQRA